MHAVRVRGVLTARLLSGQDARRSLAWLGVRCGQRGFSYPFGVRGLGCGPSNRGKHPSAFSPFKGQVPASRLSFPSLTSRNTWPHFSLVSVSV